MGRPPSENPLRKAAEIKVRLASGTTGHIPKAWNGTDVLVPVLEGLLG